MSYPTIDTTVSPRGRLDVLSKSEVAQLLDSHATGLYPLFRRCALAVLNSGSNIDDGQELLDRYPDFQIGICQQERGIRVELKGAPALAFVNGQLISGVREHLFSVIRDVLYVHAAISGNARYHEDSSEGITDAVFHILRNADLLRPRVLPNIVVCWGGHSIPRHEYDYSKKVGYQLGLRGMDICTGCGPGAMKGPMKGATIGHAKQRTEGRRYIGISEPGIIAAESPNPIVNELVIMPDIEKRLEAFVRAGHGIIVFPGGVGTAEEILYLLGLLLHPDNAHIPFPLIFTGPESSAAYFEQIDHFLVTTIGVAARERYQIIVDDPERVADAMREGLAVVRKFRRDTDDAYHFNWQLNIELDFQKPFVPTHESMRQLDLHADQPPHRLAANLRRAFSGIVAGNVKEHGINAIREHGPFEIHGDARILQPMDALLRAFVAQQRMKLPGKAYDPCYRVVL